MGSLWFVNGNLITPYGTVECGVEIRGGRVVAVRPNAPRGAQRIDVGGAYLAPGFIDLHVWGDAEILSREVIKLGTTAFLKTLGPDSKDKLIDSVARCTSQASVGAECLGLHLEGPFVNPARGGALPKRFMRAPTIRELTKLARAARGRLQLITLAPELPGAEAAVRFCRRHSIVVSLGHSEADEKSALRAVGAGARAVTHVFNGMRAFHHRDAGLLGVALTDARLTTMVIADGIHVSPTSLKLLMRAKGADCIALVTDSIRYAGWSVKLRGGAFYTKDKDGVLAGSNLTMMRAVENAVKLTGVSIMEAVHMASEVPARLLGLWHSRGSLEVGKRADLVAFDEDFRVRMTVVGGHLVYRHE